MDTLGELKNAKGRQLSVDNNKSGSAAFSITTEDNTAGLIWPWSTCLMAVNGGNVFWSGPIVTRAIDMKSRRVSVGAIGWFDRLMHLFLDAPATYTNQDAGAIIADLVAKAIIQDPSLPITMGVVQPSQLRTITYARDQSIGQAIIDLGELESGTDWYIDPVTRKMNIMTKRGIDRPEVKWIYIGDGKSEQSNLDNCIQNVDGATLTNDIRPRGKTLSGFADNAASKDQYGTFQDRPSLSTVVDLNILNAFANAEMVYRAQPRVTYTLSPKLSTKSTVPKLFRDFDIGDTTYLTARRNFVNVVDQAVRIFGASLDIRDDGSEQITNLQTTAG